MASAAVSTRRMRDPSEIDVNPAFTAAATSSSVKPPSGPIAAARPLPAAALEQVAARMSEPLTAWQILVLAPFFKTPGRMHSQEHVSAALLACFDHRALQLIHAGGLWLHDRSGGYQGREIRGAQLGQLFNEESGAVALGKSRADVKDACRVRDFARAISDNPKLHLFLTDAGYLGREFAAIAIEQRDAVTRRETTNVCQMMRLGPLEDDLAGSRAARSNRTDPTCALPCPWRAIVSALF